ncbi:MAG: hypothetical protein JSV50_10335 [Desulfobacteraceae bacterium]|nr:MAG: hypothetical protein JSV50_10335 [Desulfobacteraceae bacterium]
MKIKRKTIVIFCIAALLLLGVLCGTILYYFFNPPAVKALIEKSIARSTGTSCKIQSLSYSLKPLKIRAKGVLLKPGEDLRGFHLDIPELIADMSLEGTFGHKSLNFKNLKIDGFSIRVSHDLLLPALKQKPGTPSFLGRAVKRLIAFFLFRDIRFHAAQIVNGDMVAQAEDQTVRFSGINARLNTDHLIEVSCKMRFQWPSQKIHFTAPHLLITTDRAISFVDPEISALLKVTRATFQGQRANVDSMGMTAKLTYHHKKKTLTFSPVELYSENVTLEPPEAIVKKIRLKAQLIYDNNYKKVIFEPLDLVLEGAVISQSPETRLSPLTLHLKTQGFFDLGNTRLSASPFHLSVNETFTSKGKFDARFGSEPCVGVELLGGHVLPQKVLPFVPGELKAQLKPVTLSGPVTFHGEINGLKANKLWDWRYDLHARLKETRFSYGTGDMNLSGSITGVIRGKGQLPDISITARMKSDKVKLASKMVTLKPFTMGLSLSGNYPVFKIEELKAVVPQAKVTAGQKEILIDDIRVNIQKGALDGEKRSLYLPEIRLSSSSLKNLLLSVRVDGKHVNMVLQGKQTNFVEAALALNLLPPGWKFNGLDSIHIMATRKEKEIWSFAFELGFQEIRFENMDSTCMGEKVSLKAKMDGVINLKNAHIAANTAFEIYGGEILYDRFYLDLNSNIFSSSCKAGYDIANKHLQLSSLRLGLKDILALNIHGTMLHKTTNQRIKLSVSIPKTALKPVFDHFILEPFQTEKPFLNALNTGGAISAAIELERIGTDWMVMGHCMWHDGVLSSSENDFSFQGINLDLPVWYQTQKDESDRKTEKGTLSIRSMNLPLLPEQSLALTLDAGPNSLSVKAPTTLGIPGGNVTVGPVVSKNIFGSRLSVDTGLTINAVDINPLLSRIWSQPVHGTANGKLDLIHFEGGSIRTRGNIRVRVFDGEVILSDLGASEIFTSTPVFRLSGRWNALRLAQMTAGTSFGKIEGIMRGYIKDLEIAYGQPQKFDLLLETVKTKGVSQKISVKAVDNIARIGGGQSPFMGLAGSFATLFKEFPYKKIGVRAFLENDVFRVNGTIKEEGNEYLVKRGGFSGVNVVNQNPDNRISFKDMVKRIKRIAAKGGGPVIK